MSPEHQMNPNGALPTTRVVSFADSLRPDPGATGFTSHELTTPFDDVEGPTTVATPSCCCCCCCCVATIATSTVVTARIVRRDGAEAGRSGGRQDLRELAALLLPSILAFVVGIVMTETNDGTVDDGVRWALAIALCTVATTLFALLRTGAGRNPGHAFVTSFGLALLAALSLVVEFFLVYATVGFIWLLIPLFMWSAAKATPIASGPKRTRR